MNFGLTCCTEPAMRPGGWCCGASRQEAAEKTHRAKVPVPRPRPQGPDGRPLRFYSRMDVRYIGKWFVAQGNETGR